jgi:4-hydroxybenzoate polyprenyltransferase
MANNIAGGVEDKINKPDRPIVSGEMSLIGAKVRYVLSTTVFLTYSYVLKVYT